MTDADIIEWLVNAGDGVKVGDPLVVIETTKVAETLESPFAGTVLRTFPEAGTTIDIGTPLIAIGHPDEAASAAHLPNQ